MANGLNERQKKFAEEYVICLNASEAARRAGYQGEDESIWVTASRLLRNAKVRAHVDKLLSEQSASRAEIIGRLTSIARSDMGDFIDPATLTVNMRQAKENGLTHLVKKIKQTIISQDDRQTEIFEFELHDAQTALVHLGKVHGIFNEKTELSGEVTIKIVRE